MAGLPCQDRNRIAFFIPSLERGGVERTLINLLRIFTSDTYDLDLLFVDAREEFLRQVPGTVHIVKLQPTLRFFGLDRFIPPRVRSGIRAMSRLVEYLRRTEPDVLISFQSSVIAVLACMLARTPTRLIVRESSTPTKALSQDRWLFARVVLLLKRLSYPRSQAIIANSQGASDDLARVLKVPKSRIHVIYNPTFDDSLLERAKEPVEHAWFQAGEPPVILAVGRLSPEKDFGMLLHAFAQVREELFCRLVILGEGRERAQLEGLAGELGVQKDVDLPGFVDNPYKYMARASVFALPSRYEGLPNALIEALACGVPVVSTDCPSGPREILLDSQGGLLVPVGDAKEMAAALLRLLNDREFAHSLLQVARSGLYRFRPEVSANKYLALAEGREL